MPSIEDWQTIMALLDTALELAPAARSRWLDTVTAAHRPLVPVLQALLDDHVHAPDSSFLKTPAYIRREAPTTPPALAPDTLVGPYRLVREIGQGGMATVWLAERADGLLDRPVALKLPHLSWSDHAMAERMARERRILASLKHPNIARLYDVGIASDGRPYLALEYVDGQPVDAYAATRGLSIRERIELILQVAHAVAHAHAQLVVHRDLKPSNILIDAQGQAHLLDFGIARLIDATPDADGDNPQATLVLGRALTPDYASPEQIRGDPLGTASDIYSLGVVSFDLLVGSRPYRLNAGLGAVALAEALDRIDVPLASAAATDEASRHRLRGDLDAILRRMLARSPRDRYITVDAFANDLERHLRGEPVAARGPSPLYLLGRMLSRHRWAFGGAVLLVASLTAGLVATLWQAHRVEVERDAANRAAAREEAVRNELVNLFKSSTADRGDIPKTARAVLDASAKRVFSEYRDDPQLQGKVVVTLADLYGALDDFEGEASLLEGFLANWASGGDLESRAVAQQELAFVEVMRGHFQHAAELLPQAEATWASAPGKYRAQHLEWLCFQAMLLREQGDTDGSIRAYQEAIAQRIAYSGLVNEKTGDLYNSLALTLTRAHRMDEALVAYRATSDIDKKLGRDEEVDGLITQANIGLLDYRIGHLHEAVRVLKDVYTRQLERAGESIAVAVSMGLYGATLTSLGRAPEAIDVLRDATVMAVKYAGATSPMTIQNRLFLTDALAASGHLAEARTMSSANVVMARRQFGEAAALTLRTRIGSARIDLASGHVAAALAEFDALVEPLLGAETQGQPLAANALLGSGDAWLAQGNAAQAVRPLREAVRLREQLHWGDDNWELAVTRCRLGEALERSHAPGGKALLLQELPVLTTQLGEGHPEVQRVRRLLAEAS